MENIIIEKTSNIDALRIVLNQVKKNWNPFMIIVSDVIFTNIGINELDGTIIKSISQAISEGIKVSEMKTDNNFLILTDENKEYFAPTQEFKKL